MDKFKMLLKQVKIIREKYKEIAIAKGENFNLFDVMGMQTDEVKTHSSIIAELLNPQGSHDFGSVFLKLFLQKMITVLNENDNHEYLLNSNLEKTKAIVEYNIGQISEDYTKGGRIDILLSNDEFEICIENKINAGDQPYQLRRYFNYLKKSNKKTILIYLTLDRKAASNESTCVSIFNKDNKNWEKDESDLLEMNKDYFCTSYRTEILSWLEECYKLTIDKPILRESLKQYILLIRSLTNQSSSIEMDKEIQEVILSDIKNASLIYDNFEKALYNVADKLRSEVIKKLGYSTAFSKDTGNSFISIFIPIKNTNRHLGIESFNGKGIHHNGSLFINVFGDKEIGHKIICTNDELNSKLEQFANVDNKRQQIIIDIAEKIEDYIKENQIELQTQF